MNYLQTTFRGIGQVMLQNNMVSGILFLIGIAYNDIFLALAAFIGCNLGTLAAYLLKYDKEDIDNGLYGFNGTLVGIAIWLFFGVGIISTIALIVGAMFSSIVSKWLQKIIPPYTAPFVLVTWLFFILLPLISSLALPVAGESLTENFNLLSASAHGFGQVMFQENIVTGILFLIGILINSQLGAIYSVYATLLGIGTAYLFAVPIDSINAGLMGYNAILCAIALAGDKNNRFLWISGAVIVSVLINIGMAKIGFITLTAPFVITTWIFLKIRKQFTPQSSVV